MGLAPRSFRYQFDAATGVATLTLDRPDRLNALTFEVYAELRDAFGALDTESGVRAIVLTGAGRAFCSGGDVEDIIGALFARDADGLREFTAMTCELIANIRRCRRPVIAALNGTVAGAGAVIASACDVRVAAQSAKIAFLFGRATELLMTGDFIDAARALEIGLYQRVVPDGQALAEATALAVRLARGPSPALAVTKHALEVEASMDFEDALRFEAEVQAGLMEHPNFREAYQAFRAKREARFT